MGGTCGMGHVAHVASTCSAWPGQVSTLKGEPYPWTHFSAAEIMVLADTAGTGRGNYWLALMRYGDASQY